MHISDSSSLCIHMIILSEVESNNIINIKQRNALIKLETELCSWIPGF